MGEAYTWEVRESAENLYVYEGLTFEQVAQETGVSVSQLKRWSDDGQWQEQKKERLQNLTDLKRKRLQLHRAQLEKALGSLDPQDIYALSRLEAALKRSEPRKEQPKEIEIDRPALFLEDLQFVAEVLKEVDPEGLKIVASSFDLIVARFKKREELKALHA